MQFLDNMSELEPRFIKLYDFFSGELFPEEEFDIVIPNYQRGYKWAVKDFDNPDDESAVEYLIRTIIDSFYSNSELFLQGITVSDSETTETGIRHIIIIDGQQRLTTLYLLLWRLDKNLIQKTNLSYDVREDTDNCLKGLKSIDFNTFGNTSIGDISKQDIYFIHEAIVQIDKSLARIYAEFRQLDLINYIKDEIKAIYIPIVRKEDAVGTFTMMNGNKAIMRAEELIKSEILRLVSKACQEFSFEATSAEEVLVRLRDFTAMDWNTAEIRSRYAREWDKWLYWWNRHEVKTFFRTINESRPLGLLLDYYYRNADLNSKSYNSFRQFQMHHLHGDGIADSIFKCLRRLQKQFEDVYNDYYTYNMLSMSLSCGDRYECVSFFLKHLNDSNREEILRRYTEGRIISLKHEDAVSFALKTQETISEFDEKKDDFINSLLAKYVYGINNENAFRYLSYRNILESNKLKERFNAGIFLNRSLEHIHPKSKVYHIDTKTGKLMRGDGSLLHPENESYPDPMPKGIIKRSDIQSVDEELELSEHSICNLVLLYGRDNSEFGNKEFDEKKAIFFQVTDQKKIFISRTLQHTLSKFAKTQWGVKEMIEYYKETKNFLVNDFLI